MKLPFNIDAKKVFNGLQDIAVAAGSQVRTGYETVRASMDFDHDIIESARLTGGFGDPKSLEKELAADHVLPNGRSYAPSQDVLTRALGAMLNMTALNPSAKGATPDDVNLLLEKGARLDTPVQNALWQLVNNKSLREQSFTTIMQNNPEHPFVSAVGIALSRGDMGYMDFMMLHGVPASTLLTVYQSLPRVTNVPFENKQTVSMALLSFMAHMAAAPSALKP